MVAAVRFKKTPVRMAQAIARVPGGSYAAGTAIASQLNRPSLRAILVLSDGLHVNGSELVNGLNESLGGTTSLRGGWPAMWTHFKRTSVLKGRTLKAAMLPPSASMAITSMLGHWSNGGWDKFGPERLVTKSRGHVLYELDGRPALHLYKEYLGDRAAGLPEQAFCSPWRFEPRRLREKSSPHDLSRGRSRSIHDLRRGYSQGM